MRGEGGGRIGEGGERRGVGGEQGGGQEDAGMEVRRRDANALSTWWRGGCGGEGGGSEWRGVHAVPGGSTRQC